MPELGGGEVNPEVSEWLRQEYTPLRKKNKFTSFKAHVQGVVFTLRLRRMTVTKTCSAPSDVLPFQVSRISPADNIATYIVILTGTCCRGTGSEGSLVRSVWEFQKENTKEDEAVFGDVMTHLRVPTSEYQRGRHCLNLWASDAMNFMAVARKPTSEPDGNFAEGRRLGLRHLGTQRGIAAVSIPQLLFWWRFAQVASLQSCPLFVQMRARM